MRLAQFLRDNQEPILAEFEAFAATLLPAAGGMTGLALRDHAAHILEAVARDLETVQSREQQSENRRVGRRRSRAPRRRRPRRTRCCARAAG